MALIQACKENVAAKEAARIKEKNQYRPSSAMVNIFGDKKKIEEDYAFYDQPVEDDKEDELLESIMEEVDAEDEEEKDFREDIKELDRQIQQKQDKLEETASQMNDLTGTKPFEMDESEEGEDNLEDEKSSDDEEFAEIWEGKEESDGDEEEKHKKVYKSFEEKKTLVKLSDKIKMLKHRCEASLGFTLYEKAYKLIKKKEENLRKRLSDLIGEENIGFYVVFNNILFLEKKKKDIMAK